jgi:sentrin-specific protease 7
MKSLASSSYQVEIKQILIYPPGTGGMPINTEDYMCLATDQYLNDVIIDFYLNYLRLELLDFDQRKRTHIFSTFFYKRLTTMTSKHRQEKDFAKMTAAQKRHLRVKTWTKNVNLFEKDFIIIPINEQSHWFLAIVCFPHLNEPHTMDTNQPIKLQPVAKRKSEFFFSVKIVISDLPYNFL